MNYPDSDTVPAIWEVGDVILDLYEVKQVFTGGGMGLVYRVHHRGWNMDLAVKSPRPEFFQTQTQIENFEREAETWVNLGLHPCTVSCYYVRRLGGIPRLFAEFIDQGSLADLIRSRALYEGGPEKALARILDIAIQSAWGLHYAHEKGLIHQDVKPANILLSSNGAARVTDFGLAKAQAVAGEGTYPSLGQIIIGTYRGMTPGYCSPEQAEIAAQRRSGVAQTELSRLTQRTDIWSWAITVFEMFTSEPPCPMGGQAAAQVFEEYLVDEKSDSALPPMPGGVVELLRNCFQRNPDDRPHEPAHAAASLKEIYQAVIGREYPRRVPKAIDAAADELNNRALSLLDLGNRKKAKSLFDEAIRRHPEHLEATYNRGVMLWRSSSDTDAKLVAELEVIRAAKPNDWRVAYLLGLVYLELTDKECAVQMLEEAVRLGGTSEVATALETTRSLTAAQTSWAARQFKGHRKEVWSVCLSSDGLLALSGGKHDDPRLWDAATGKCIRTFQGHTHSVSCVSLSLDNQFALSGDLDDALRLWKVSNGECLRVIQVYVMEEGEQKDPGCGYYINSICMTSDNKYALSAWGETFCLWDLATGERLRTFEGHTGEVESLFLSSDNRWVLSGSSGQHYGDKNLRLWEVVSGQCLRVFEGHAEGINSACLSLDNRLALSGSDDKTLRVWDVATGECLRILVGHTDQVNSVQLSSDGAIAVSGSDDETVRIWDVGSARCLRTIDLHTRGLKLAAANSVCLSADNQWVISGNSDHTLRLWNIRGLISNRHDSLAPFLLCHVVTAEVASDAKSRFDQCVLDGVAALANQRWDEALKHGKLARCIPGYEVSFEALKLWNDAGLHSFRHGFRAGWEFLKLECPTGGVNCWHGVDIGGVTSVCLSSDNQWALSGSADNHLHLWEVSSGKCLRIFEGHAKGVTCVYLSANKRLAWSGSDDGTVRVWDTATGLCLRVFEGHTNSIESICVTSDNRWLFSAGCMDATLHLWDVATGDCLRTLKGTPYSTISICLSADNLYLLTGSCARVEEILLETDKNLRLWNLTTEKLHQLSRSDSSRGGRVHCLSSDKKWVVSEKQTILELWSLETGECHRVFEGHRGGVSSLCISMDNRWILSGSWDKTVRLWDSATGKCLRVLEGHSSNVTSVCLSSDNRWALSASRDNTLRLWALDWDFEPRAQVEWDDGARFVLTNFLAVHIPYTSALSKYRTPTEQEITHALTRTGTPTWSDSDFKQLLYTLACAGYGWLNPDGVRRELVNMAASFEENAHSEFRESFPR